MPHGDLESRLAGLAAVEAGPPPPAFVGRVTRRRWARRARAGVPALVLAAALLGVWSSWPAGDRPHREVAILPVVSPRPESLAALRRGGDAGDPRPDAGGGGGSPGLRVLTPLDGYRAGGFLGAELSQ
jgi:hypothetical protein